MVEIKPPNEMPTLRKTVCSEHGVLVAPDRALRPNQYGKKDTIKECPFCRGNEDKTPNTRLILPIDADEKTWQVRVVSNRFPALRTEGDSQFVVDPLHSGTIVAAHGAAEVIIECPGHDRDYTVLEPWEFALIFQAIVTQTTDLYQDVKIKFIQVFKNSGDLAGATLFHPHTQLIALPTIPSKILRRLDRFQAYQQDNGISTFAKMEERSREQNRILVETEHFVCVSPFEARLPFESWIFPKDSCPNFSDSAQHFEELGQAFQAFFRMLARTFDGKLPAFNGILDEATPKSQRNCTDYVRWRYKILPRITTIGGFEFATGVHINPTAAEKAAEFLRNHAH